MDTTVSQSKVDKVCCVLHDKKRCNIESEGTTLPSLNKRLQRAIWVRHKLEIDETVAPMAICSQHRETIFSIKKELDQKRRKPEAPKELEVVTIDFATLPPTLVKRYRKKFNIVTGEPASKTEVVGAIERHFHSLPVNEGKDIVEFLKFIQRTRSQCQVTETPDFPM